MNNPVEPVLTKCPKHSAPREEGNTGEALLMSLGLYMDATPSQICCSVGMFFSSLVNAGEKISGHAKPRVSTSFVKIIFDSEVVENIV